MDENPYKPPESSSPTANWLAQTALVLGAAWAVWMAVLFGLSVQGEWMRP